MSRTYKRTSKHTKRAWVPYIISSRYYNGQPGNELYSWRTRFQNDSARYGSDPKKIERFLEENPKYRNEIGAYFLSRYTPKYYRTVTTDIPNRYHDRKLCRKIIREEIDIDEAVWSRYRKPNYYW